MGKLTVKGVQGELEPGAYYDGDGLQLHVAASGTKKWVFRFSFAGKVRQMGLGSAKDITLAQARAAAADARKLVAQGVNPIDQKRQAPEAPKPTFGEIADAVIEAKAPGWRSERHRDQWASSLTLQAAALRPLPVDEVGVEEVLAVLKPLWLTTPESASRLRQRIEAVLDAAKARGLRSGDNPAAWKGNLAHLLTKRPSIDKGHHAAMHYEAAPDFMARLRELDTTSAMALEFAILTAARTGEVLGATWQEIDLGAKVWTIPKERMKSGREHRVPLPDRAVEILTKHVKLKSSVSDHVFPSPMRGKKGLSHIAMQKVLARLESRGPTVHGFRSSFRDWAGNETHVAREIVEAALAHSVGDATERAYRRSDALEKRRALMTAWAQHCEPKDARNIVPMKSAKPK